MPINLRYERLLNLEPMPVMSRTEKIVFPILILALCVSSYVHFLSANAADKNWLLAAANMLVSGKKLYTDIFEINPPLIVWLYTVPVWLAQQIRFLTDFNLLVLLGLALIGLVIRLSLGLLAQHPAFENAPRKRTWFGFLLAFVFIFCTAPMFFFDREHILLVLSFPYILRFTPTLSNVRVCLSRRITIGLLAAVGFCIKPHALLFFGVLQLFYLLRERSLRIALSLESVMVGLFAAGYGAIIYFTLPEYIHTVLPMAMVTYAAYSRKVTGIYSLIVFVVIMAITFVDFRSRHRSPLRRDVYYFIGVCFAYLLYALANNGWAYTYNPLISMARILTGWVLFEFLWLRQNAEAQSLPSREYEFGARACIFNLVLNGAFYAFLLVSYFIPQDCRREPNCRSAVLFMREAKHYKGHSFGSMSLEFGKWSEFSRETGERWDTRFNHLWMIPQFVLSGPEFAVKNAWITEYVGKAYADDFNLRKPDIIYVDDSPHFFGKQGHFDLLGYMAQNPAFRDAWTHYRQEGIINACVSAEDSKSKDVKSDCRFNVYRRVVTP